MREDQFLVVLPSNSSMRHYPNNKTSSFVTELPQAIHLHGEWEVALSEIQFPSTFYHVNADHANELYFLDIKDGEAKDKKLTAKRVLIHNGVYKDIEELISEINSASKEAGSPYFLQLQKKWGGKIMYTINCAKDSCKLVHYMHLPDNVLKMLGSGSCLTAPESSEHTTLTVSKPDSEDTFTGRFIKAGYFQNGKTVYGFWAGEPNGLQRGIPDKLFVYCDICEPYITGDVQTPLLRIAPVETYGHNHADAYGTNQAKHFSPLHYIPLRQTNFRRIEIDIRDEFGKNIPFYSGTLTVTLHFRRYK